MEGKRLDRETARAIEELLTQAHSEGRSSLREAECYQLFRLMGAEASPRNLLLSAGSDLDESALSSFLGEKVVLKVVSPDIIHKTEAGGVRIVPREPSAIREAVDQMITEVPETYARHLVDAGEQGSVPGSEGPADLVERLRERLQGIMVCSFVEQDEPGFAGELFLGLRHTGEFGPVLTAGLGGVTMETLASRSKKGAAVVMAPAGDLDGTGFLQVFRSTLSYQRLTGKLRGSRAVLGEEVLVECFQAFLDLARHFSSENPEAPFHLEELEVNPFVVQGGRLAPLDGVCRFTLPRPARTPRPVEKLASLLRPGRVGVIGVSESKQNMGRIILGNVLAAGFEPEKVRVVHPKAEVIDGVPCVATLGDLDQKLDLLVVAVGAPQVPGVLEELLEHDAAEAVILIPGGLGEKEGQQDVEKRLREKIQAAHRGEGGGPVLLGGNSLGVISHPGNYDTMFIPDVKLPKSRGDHPRKLCFLSQSGAFIISNLSRMPWLDPAYALSMGNQIDLTAGDILGYLKDDPDLEVFAVYMEGFQDGDGLAFARAVRETVALGKDVVFYKAGRTQEGRSATAGHTASVAGDYVVCESALEQAGALVAQDFQEFGDLLKVTLGLRGKSRTGNRVATLSNAGYEAVGMADSLDQGDASLQLPRFSAPVHQALEEELKSHRLDGLVDVKNPLDVTPMATDKAFTELVETMLTDPVVDSVVAGIVPLTPAMQTLPEGEGHRESLEHEGSIAQRLPRLAAGQDKPVLAVVDSGQLFDPLCEVLEAGGVPTFRSSDRAMRALGRWSAAGKR